MTFLCTRVVIPVFYIHNIGYLRSHRIGTWEMKRKRRADSQALVNGPSEPFSQLHHCTGAAAAPLSRVFGEKESNLRAKRHTKTPTLLQPAWVLSLRVHENCQTLSEQVKGEIKQTPSEPLNCSLPPLFAHLNLQLKDTDTSGGRKYLLF